MRNFWWWRFFILRDYEILPGLHLYTSLLVMNSFSTMRHNQNLCLGPWFAGGWFVGFGLSWLSSPGYLFWKLNMATTWRRRQFTLHQNPVFLSFPLVLDSLHFSNGVQETKETLVNDMMVVLDCYVTLWNRKPYHLEISNSIVVIRDLWASSPFIYIFIGVDDFSEGYWCL